MEKELDVRRVRRELDIILFIDLTSHRLRHTFATYALNHNVPIEVVARILGHTKIATTQIYAKLLSSSVEDAMSKLDATIV